MNDEKAAIFGAGAALGVAAVSDRKAVVFGAGAAVGAAALYLASRRPAQPPTPSLPVFSANPTAGPLIYMDYNATTPIDPRVAAAMVPYLGEQGWGNPSSSHALGRSAKDAVGKARAHGGNHIGDGMQRASLVVGEHEAHHSRLGRHRTRHLGRGDAPIRVHG